MLILGVNAFHGDASAALVRDGQLLSAVEEERFNRVKHSAGVPLQAVKHCLSEASVDLADIDHIAVSRDPTAHLFDKAAYALTHRTTWSTQVMNRARNAANVRRLPAVLNDSLGSGSSRFRGKMHFVEHHNAHIASAFFVSPFERSAVLSLDGFGDFVSASWGAGQGSTFAVRGRVKFPHSLGILYTAITQWLGFPKYGDEGKIMGLAAYGRPRHMAKFQQLARVHADGSFELDLRYFVHHTTGVSMTWESGTPVMSRCYSDKLIELFGPPRGAGSALTEYIYDVASSLQQFLEDTVLAMMSHLQHSTGERALSYAGGVALNSALNGKILDQTPFTDVFIQPAAGDNGTSVGAAFYVWSQVLRRSRSFVMDHAYTGPQYTDDEIRQRIEAHGILSSPDQWSVVHLKEPDLLGAIASHLANGQVVGFFHGRMEFGPRALGNRSILVDPRRAEMKDVLNSRIKHRESFRPFAPSILEEYTDAYFERSYPSPAMLMVYNVRESMRSVIPAVTHVDGTGRLQTVSQRTNPRYWRLIDEFRKRTGVPVVLNTSFNENEPIVCTPDDALACFARTRIDVLALGNWLISRSEVEADATPVPSAIES